MPEPSPEPPSRPLARRAFVAAKRAEVRRVLSIVADRLRRRSALVLVIALLGAAAGFGWAHFHPTSYTARAALTLPKVEGESKRRTPEANAVLLRGYADYFNQPGTQARLRQRASVPPEMPVVAVVTADNVFTVQATTDDPKSAQVSATDMAALLRDEVHDNLASDTLSDLRRDRVASQAQLTALEHQPDGGGPGRRPLQNHVNSVDRQIAQAQLQQAQDSLQNLPAANGVITNLPHTPRWIALGAAASLALGAVLALILGSGENRIAEAEIRRLLALDTVAVVGRRGSRGRRSPASEQRADDLRPFVETLGSKDRPLPMTLAVTAAGAGRAKSGVAELLAEVRAEHGEPTLLVQTDLDRVDAVPGLATQPGVTDYLESRAESAVTDVDLDRHVVENGHHLLLAPLGSGAARGFRLFARAGLTVLMRRATTLADLVVVDAPAALAAPEAEIVCSVADAAVLVLEEGRTRSADAVRAVESLRRADVHLLGAVLVRRRSDVGTASAIPRQTWQPLRSHTPAPQRA